MSGLLTRQRESSPARILDAGPTARFPYLLSLRLLAEYRSVLLREPIRKRHQLTAEQIDSILTEIAANGILRDLPETGAHSERSGGPPVRRQ